MTARIIRRGVGKGHWHLTVWRVVLAVAALLVVWLILSSVAAAPPAFLRSHPLTTDRTEKLRAAYADLQTADPKARLYLGRENLRRRITRSQQEFAE